MSEGQRLDANHPSVLNETNLPAKSEKSAGDVENWTKLGAARSGRVSDSEDRSSGTPCPRRGSAGRQNNESNLLNQAVDFRHSTPKIKRKGGARPGHLFDSDEKKGIGSTYDQDNDSSKNVNEPLSDTVSLPVDAEVIVVGASSTAESPDLSKHEARIASPTKSAISAPYCYPLYSPPLSSNPSTPPISLPITPPGLSTVYGAIAMSMPGQNTKTLNGDTYQRVEESEEDKERYTTQIKQLNESPERRNGHLSISVNPDIDDDEDDDTGDNCNEHTQIYISGEGGGSEFGRLARRKDRENFPSEKKKTLIAFIWFAACLTITCFFITLAHDRYPDYKTNHPLPDLVLENFKVQEWAFPASEYCAMALTVIWYTTVLLHRHKWILLRRQFFVMGLLYLYRCVTMIITNLPRAYDSYECAPKTKGTLPEIIQRSLRIMMSAGMSTAGELHTCGDWVFSGHTCVLVTTYLFIQEYSPRRLWPLHWACAVTSFVGVVLILLGHDHYTLDCVLAYYVCTRLFWIYHTLVASNPSLSVKRSLPNRGDPAFQINRVLWFRLFDYFECNVKGHVPRQYGWPLPWPRSWAAKHKEFD